MRTYNSSFYIHQIMNAHTKTIFLEINFNEIGLTNNTFYQTCFLYITKNWERNINEIFFDILPHL